MNLIKFGGASLQAPFVDLEEEMVYELRTASRSRKPLLKIDA